MPAFELVKELRGHDEVVLADDSGFNRLPCPCHARGLDFSGSGCDDDGPDNDQQ
jgi:hypothetical protein